MATIEARSEAAAAAAEIPAVPGFPPVTQWRLVIALTLIAMLALLDKYALSLLVQPLKADLGLNDTEVGLAVGTAFAIANIAIGIPAGLVGAAPPPPPVLIRL